MAKGLRFGLKEEGFEVHWAESGRKSLALVDAKNPRLLILDIRLLDLSVYDVCKTLRAAGNPLPILMLTASYMALAVLTASLVGILSLSLIKRYTKKKEREYLTLTARNIAGQIKPLISLDRNMPDIRELVKATGFMSNVRIRVLDRQKRLLVDSGDQDSSTYWFRVPLRIHGLDPEGELIILSDVIRSRGSLREPPSHLPSKLSLNFYPQQTRSFRLPLYIEIKGIVRE